MSPIFEVSEEEVEHLPDRELVDVMNRLLKVEGWLHDIPPNCIHTTLRHTIPDGGIDARIDDATAIPATCWIPEGLSVWQFKAGKVKPVQMRCEAHKPGVKEAIRVGGTYCVALGMALTEVTRSTRLAAMNEVFDEESVPHKSRLLSAHQIADWINDYPAIRMLHYFSQPLGDELFDFERWRRLEELHADSVEFESDEERDTFIAELARLAQDRERFYHMRIVGRAGIGKTRLALEGIRTNQLQSIAIYCLSPQGLPDALFTYVRNRPSIRNLILVVDECSTNDVIRLRRIAEGCDARLLLLTIEIEHDETVEPDIRTEAPIHCVQGLSPESMKKVLQRAVPNIYPDLIDFIVRVSEGYVKLAIAIAEALARRPDLAGSSQLTRLSTVRPLLEALVPDRSTYQAMRALSLLRQVGVDGEVSGEAVAISGFVGISVAELRAKAEEMRRRGVVAKRGRYRYVTPHLLAVWFASDIWEERGEDIVNDLLLAQRGLPSDAPKMALLHRLADLGDEALAMPAVEALLRDDAPFRTINDIDSAQGSLVFCSLARAAPKAGAAALHRLLSEETHERLSEFGEGRRRVVWLLEKLVGKEDTFWTSAGLLRRLAEAENESIANNATTTWLGLFYLQLGGTPVPALKRHALIREALDSVRLNTRLLAVRAIESALSVHEMRLHGTTLGGHIVQPEWRPSTWGEVRQVRRSALEMLDQALQDEDPEVSASARDVLDRTALPLIHEGLHDDVIPRLRGLPVDDEESRVQLRETLQKMLSHLGEDLTSEQQDEIKEWIRELVDETLRGNLLRWVADVRFVDISALRDEGEEPEDKAASVAEQAFQNPEELRIQLEWLVSVTSQYIYSFGRRLGELDSEHVWLEPIVAAVRRGGNATMLSAYLQGRSDCNEADWVGELLDGWSRDDQDMAHAVFDATWRMGGSDARAERLIRMTDSGWIPSVQLGQLMWGAWVEPLSVETMQSLMRRVAVNENGQATEVGLSLLLTWLRRRVEQAPTMAEYALALLERPVDLGREAMLSFYWEQMAMLYLESHSERLAEAVLRAFSDESLFPYDNARMSVLGRTLVANPEAVWPLIGRVLLAGDAVSYRLGLSFGTRGGLGSEHTELLLNWAEKHGPRGPQVLAQVAAVEEVPLSPLPRQLLIRFGEDPEVGAHLASRFQSGTWSSSRVAWLESKRATAEQWLHDEEAPVREWAQNVITSIETQIARARQREEEDELEDW